MKPTVGRIVHYRLSASDAEQINRRRNDFTAFNAAHRDAAGNEAGSFPGRSGHVGHFGNEASEGDVHAADVVAVPGNGEHVNLQVKLDGNDLHWATSRPEGDTPGTWSWPPRAEHQPGDRPPRY